MQNPTQQQDRQGEENDVRWVKGTWTNNNKLDVDNNNNEADDDNSWIDTIFDEMDDTKGKGITQSLQEERQRSQLDNQVVSNTPVKKLSLATSGLSPCSLVDMKRQGRRHAIATTTKGDIPRRQFPFKPYVGMIGTLDDKELLSELEANTRPM